METPDSDHSQEKFTPSIRSDEEISKPSESLDDSRAEKIDHKPITTIDVRRHSEYEDSFPEAGWGKASESEKERLGHLTEAGVENARRVAQEIVQKRLDESGNNVDFLVIASPTHWLGDESLGQRAIETAKIYSDEIEDQLEERGLPSDRFLNTIHRPSSQHEVGNVRVGKKMVEAQIFDDPRGLDLIDELRSKYGGQGKDFWNAWYTGADNDALDAVGAERSTEAADRADKMIEALVRYGELHNKATGRSLEAIVITHHEVLQPYGLHILGVSQNEFEPGKNEGFEVRVEDGRAVATVAGREVERKSRYDRRHSEES
jgi:broad specificity phosphatase PhoE